MYVGFALEYKFFRFLEQAFFTSIPLLCFSTRTIRLAFLCPRELVRRHTAEVPLWKKLIGKFSIPQVTDAIKWFVSNHK